MPALHRRHFLGSSMAGLAAALSWNPVLLAQNALSKETAKPADGQLALDTLFLSWQRDPTTTMTVQWVGPETSADTSIRYATESAAEKTAVASPVWQVGKTSTKPYPNTDFKVYRSELTALKPGTEYQFQVGKGSPTYRFRTMPARATNTIQFVSGGDCGVDLHAVGTNILAARQEPYFALIAGDLAYDNGRSPETFTRFLQNYREHMVDP